MTQWVHVTKSDHLSSILRTHTVEKRTGSCKLPSRVYMCVVVHHKHNKQMKYKSNKFEKKRFLGDLGRWLSGQECLLYNLSSKPQNSPKKLPEVW